MTFGPPDPLRVAAGAADAEATIQLLKVNLGDGNELYHRVRCLQRDDDFLLGWMRVIQKHVERAK